jgi:hypothetical protein
MPDQSPDRIHDLAAHQAVRSVVRDGLFIPIRRKYFSVNHYWDDLDDLREDAQERWKDDILFSEETWQRAEALLKKGNGERRIRFPFRKKVSVYQKQQRKE